MPLVEVKLYDRRINDDVVPQVIEKVTDAICDVIGEDIREHTWVLVEGLSPRAGIVFGCELAAICTFFGTQSPKVRSYSSPTSSGSESPLCSPVPSNRKWRSSEATHGKVR